MADLRITGVTASHLELEDSAGVKHTLEITEDLLKALRARKPSSSLTALTPREIQERIRLGSTIEQLLLTNPSDEEAIRKYGAPIVAELNHVVSLARNVRLNLAVDRFSDPSNIEFGLVMDERLRANGINTTSWSAKRSHDGQWLVSVNFTQAGIVGGATWSFNAKQLLLTPEDQTAIQLSNNMPLTVLVTPELNVVSNPVIQETFTHPVMQTPEIQEPPITLSVVPEILDTEVIEVVETIEPDYPPTLRVMNPAAEDIFDMDYLDEVLDKEPQEDKGIDVVQVSELQVVVEEPLVDEPERPIAEKPKPASTSRWAEVLFGNKSEDEETN